MESDDNKPLTRGDFKAEMAKHEAVESADNRHLLETFMSAFPNGELAPHREYHQAKINAANAEKAAEESRKKMYDAAISKIADRGIEGIFGVAKILVVIGLAALALKMGVAIPAWLIK